MRRDSNKHTAPYLEGLSMLHQSDTVKENKLAPPDVMTLII